jgi:hypothetical protein
MLLASWLLCACAQSNRGEAPAQPVAFSHALHAGERQVPCLYCHWAARHGRHAGVPETRVCMSCHGLIDKQPDGFAPVAEAHARGAAIEWAAVHDLPDHTWFSHAAHEAAEVGCDECHGEVERMARVEQAATMSMGWCLDCHREPREGLEKATTDCFACHR